MYLCISASHKCNNGPLKNQIGFYRPPNQHKHLNYNERPDGTAVDTIVLHYTVLDYSNSYDVLAHANGGRPGPSVHYMINIDGRIDSLVGDDKVAWHAGPSSWLNISSVNARSIGIELVNPGSGEQGCYPVANEEAITDAEKCKKK